MPFIRRSAAHAGLTRACSAAREGGALCPRVSEAEIAGRGVDGAPRALCSKELTGGNHQPDSSHGCATDAENPRPAR